MIFMPPTALITPVSYTHLDVYKRQVLESVAYSQTFAFLPRRDDGPTTTHFPSNFAFFSPYRPKIRYQALQSLKNHSKIKRYVL